MSQSYKELIQQLNPPLSTLRKEAAETMSGFDSMSKAAMSAGVLSALDKELIAAAIAVSTRCEGCIHITCGLWCGWVPRANRSTRCCRLRCIWVAARR